MDNESAITVVLADDHYLIRVGFQFSFRKTRKVKVVAMASNGIELLEAVSNHNPDVVFTDIEMPEMDGLVATKVMKEKFPTVKVIALSNYDQVSLIQDMYEAGADGYLKKNADDEEVMESINTVMAGKKHFCPAVSDKLLKKMKDDINKLENKIIFSKRELQVLRLIADNKSNREIADILGISHRTVESHRHSLEEKIGVKSTVGLAIWACQNKYLKQDPEN